MEFGKRYASHVARDTKFLGQLENGSSCYTRKAVVSGRCKERAVVINHENIGRIGLTNIPINIQHNGIGCTGQVGLNLGKNVVDLEDGIESGQRSLYPRGPCTDTNEAYQVVVMLWKKVGIGSIG